MMKQGKLVGVSGSVAEVAFVGDFPERNEILKVATESGDVQLEVVSSARKGVLYCLV